MTLPRVLSRIAAVGWINSVRSVVRLRHSACVSRDGRSHNSWNGSGLSATPNSVAILLHIALTWGASAQTSVDFRGQQVRGVSLGELDLDEVAIRNLALQDCVVGRLVVGSLAAGSSISASATHFQEISGVGSMAGLPRNIALDAASDVERFESLATTASIVALNLDPRTKALLTALNKLYRQRGAGRVIGAFRRGVPDDVRGHVDAVLDLLVREGFAHRQKDVYHPIRKNTGRAHRILDNPRASQDPIMTEVLRT